MAKRTAAKDDHTQQIYLQLTAERRDGYFHLYGRFSTQKFENHQWIPYGVDDTYSDGLLWSGLRTSCQGDEQSRRRGLDAGEQGPVYGWDAEYRDVYSVDLRRVRRMGKTLEKLERGLAKLREVRGYPRSYGEYVGRVAEVLGCSGMVFQTTNRYDQQRWTWLSIGDGVNRTDHLVAQWVEEGKPKVEARTEQATEQAS